MNLWNILEAKQNWINIMLSGLNLLKLFLTSLSTRKGKENAIADALSRRYTMLSQLDHKFFGL
jgi:hypothetical protein